MRGISVLSAVFVVSLAGVTGCEPVDYVRDIHAYSFALRLGYDERIRRDLDRESLKP